MFVCPKYGGYDPIGISRSVAVRGIPIMWLVSGEKRSCSTTAAASKLFVADPDRATAAADVSASKSCAC
jgi:hypothetical protein